MEKEKNISYFVKYYKDAYPVTIFFSVAMIPLTLYLFYKSFRNWDLHFWWLLAALIDIWFHTNFISAIFRNKKNYNILQKAQKFDQAGFFVNATRMMKLALKNDKLNKDFAKFVENYINKKHIHNSELLMPSPYSPKIDGIFEQNEEKILAHIDLFLKAKQELEKIKSKNNIHNELKEDLNKIADKYEKLMLLEKEKLNFYKEIQTEILEFKKNRIEKSKLKIQKEELKKMDSEYANLEEKIIRTSVKEKYDTDTQELLEEEKIFLQTVEYYNDKLDIADNDETINELQKDWNSKRKKQI